MNIDMLHRRARGLKTELRSIARAAVRPPTAPPAERRFVLFGRGRTGSTVLVSLLNGHPEVASLGELLNNPALAPISLVERELARLTSSRRGFKLLSYQVHRQMRPGQIRALRDWLTQDGLTIFHLQRDNLLRHALSNLYARERQMFHAVQGRDNEIKRFHVPTEKLFAWIESSANLFEWEKRFLGDLPRDGILYERDLSTPAAQQATLDRMLERLGLDPVPASTELKPVTPRDFDSFIENWDEVAQALAASPWARFLED